MEAVEAGMDSVAILAGLIENDCIETAQYRELHQLAHEMDQTMEMLERLDVIENTAHQRLFTLAQRINIRVDGLRLAVSAA